MTTNAGAVGAGTAIAGQIVPHPLKGIINSNDDPFVCPLCVRSAVTGRLGHLMACCGKELCRMCGEKRSDKSMRPLGCSSQPIGSKFGLKLLKRHAKKGKPWAQDTLGMCYLQGSLVRQSFSEAFGWLAMAATKGHPSAMEAVGAIYLKGSNGVSADLSKARHFYEASLATGFSTDGCCEGLLLLALDYMTENSEESKDSAKSILHLIIDRPSRDLTVFDRTDAMYHFALLLLREKNDVQARPIFMEYLTTDGTQKFVDDVLFNLMLCCSELNLWAQSRFCFGKIKLSEIPSSLRRDVVKAYIHQRTFFRKLRDTCGACGAKFEGKDRKFCGGCRAFCYCSRECQKMHWNRKVNGHREDCLGLKDLKVKLKEAKKKSDEHGN